jgi:hypothetical protein
MDGVVEQIRLRGREVVVITIRGVTREVKISSNEPRDRVPRVMSRKRLKKIRLGLVIAWGVDIREPEDRAVIVDSKVERENVARSVDGREAKGVGVPSGNEPTRGTNRVDSFKGPRRRGRKEWALMLEMGPSFDSWSPRSLGEKEVRSARTRSHLTGSPSPRTFQDPTGK